jgi:FixJ family two-component response regulator
MAGPTRFVVAVVDDDPRTLESLADLLEAAGYDVRLYSSARMIWRRGVSDIDCLISDIGMPDMNGIELRRLVLAERPELPVILITGRPEVRAQYPSIVIERDRYFEKPYDGQQLLAAVRAALTPREPKRAAE